MMNEHERCCCGRMDALIREVDRLKAMLNQPTQVMAMPDILEQAGWVRKEKLEEAERVIGAFKLYFSCIQEQLTFAEDLL